MQPVKRKQEIQQSRKNIANVLLSNSKLNPNRFSGRRVRQNSKKIAQMQKRDNRLRKFGLTVLMFNS